MEKRNNAVDLTDLAIGILVLGIVVTVGTRILLLYRDSRLTDLPLLSVANETNTTTVTDTSTPWRLTNTWVESVDACHNSTSSLIPTTNYTATITDFGFAEIVNLSGEHNIEDWNCTYDYYDTTEAQWALPNDAAVGIAEYGNWFDIIVIVGIAGLILSLIFLAFGRGKEGSGEIAY